MSYFVEVTDTYGGEANYCWVNRYIVKAKSFRGAVRKVAKAEGYSGRVRLDYSTGDSARHNIKGAAICILSRWADEDEVSRYLFVKTI